MKNTKISVLALLAVVCALLACAFTVTAGAEEAGAAVDLGQVNVAFNEQIQLAFTVETTDALPEGAVVGIAAWAADEAEPTAENYSYVNFNVKEYGGKSYYRSIGIPATETDVLYQYAACYKHNGVVTIGKVYQYSPIKFAGTRLTESNTADQAKLYEKLIDYAISADKLITNNPINYAFVKTVNGYVGNCSATIGGWLGKTVLLRAEAKNADGEYFVKWVDANGETVSTSRLAKVQVTASGITEYTAVYGEAADSAYATTYDFEALSCGTLTIFTPANTSSAPNTNSYGTVGRVWGTSATIGKLVISTNAVPTLIEGKKYKDDKDDAFLKDENGRYVISARDYYTVTVDESGDQQLYHVHNEKESGGSLNFTNPDTEKAYYAVETDYIVEDPSVGSTYFIRPSVEFANRNYSAETKDVLQLRINPSYDKTSGVMQFYLEGSSSDTHVYADEAIELDNAETMTVALYLNPNTVEKVVLVEATADTAEVYTYTADLELYVNGELLDSFDLLTECYAYYSKVLKQTDGAYTQPLYYDLSAGYDIDTLLISGTSSTRANATYDNVTFLESYK